MKIIKCEITIPTGVYANIKPVIEVSIPDELNPIEEYFYLWDMFHNLSERRSPSKPIAKSEKPRYKRNFPDTGENSFQSPTAGYAGDERLADPSGEGLRGLETIKIF